MFWTEAMEVAEAVGFPAALPTASVVVLPNILGTFTPLKGLCNLKKETVDLLQGLSPTHSPSSRPPTLHGLRERGHALLGSTLASATLASSHQEPLGKKRNSPK
jgi:hypothetical protein